MQKLSLNEELFEAIYNKKISHVISLINSGANINCKYSEGKTPLMLASENPSDSIVKLLLKCGANIQLTTEETCENALHWCAKWGNVKCLTTLIEAYKKSNSFNINIQNSNGETPLMLAASNDNIYNTREILKYNPDVFIMNKDNLNVFQLIQEIHKKSDRRLIINFLANYYTNQAIEKMLGKSFK